MDPNITVMKPSHMAMLACDAAFRVRPAAFAAIFVSNTAKFREQPHFLSFASALHATKAGIMTFEPRFVSADFLANHCDAVVTHQWQSGLDYLYYEVLHGGYPLIHNSEFLRDYGYYYPEFAADVGGAVLLDALDRHATELGAYHAAAARLVAQVSPTNPANIARHEALVATVRAAPPRASATTASGAAAAAGQ